MAHRYDKYDPKSGGFRAPLAQSWPDAGDSTVRAVGRTYGVELNGSGQIVITGGNTGHIGVLVVDKPKAAGDIVDVMTDGEIADFTDYLDGDSDPTAPGDRVWTDANGVLTNSAPSPGRAVGFVVQTNGYNRLIVRVGESAA